MEDKGLNFWQRLNSIKVFVFLLVFAASCYFLQVGKIPGAIWGGMMSLVVGIFTWGHEHAKGLQKEPDLSCETPEE